MNDWLSQTVSSGSLLLALPVALVAGLVSFFSPCVVPLLPGYLSYVSGVAVQDLDSARRSRLLAGSLLFVLGFSTVFVLSGALFGSIGTELRAYQRPLSIGTGVLVIAVGLAFIGWLPFLQRDVRVHAVPAVGLAMAPVLGSEPMADSPMDNRWTTPAPSPDTMRISRNPSGSSSMEAPRSSSVISDPCLRPDSAQGVSGSIASPRKNRWCSGASAPASARLSRRASKEMTPGCSKAGVACCPIRPAMTCDMGVDSSASTTTCWRLRVRGLSTINSTRMGSA